MREVAPFFQMPARRGLKWSCLYYFKALVFKINISSGAGLLGNKMPVCREKKLTDFIKQKLILFRVTAGSFSGNGRFKQFNDPLFRINASLDAYGHGEFQRNMTNH